MLERGAARVQPLFDAFCNQESLNLAVQDFALAFVRFITTEEILAFRRIVYAEGAKSELGKLFYENGPKRGWSRMAEDFAAAMDQGLMRRADPWVAVNQFHALCEAGPVQRLLEGSLLRVDEQDLVGAAKAAADTFIRAYGLQVEG
jgi:hypothetical protein